MKIGDLAIDTATNCVVLIIGQDIVYKMGTSILEAFKFDFEVLQEGETYCLDIDDLEIFNEL